MSINDLQVVSSNYTVRKFTVDDRNTSLTTATFKPGEPVKRGGATSDFVILLADGEPIVASSIFVGIVDSESTEVAATEGTVGVKVVRESTEIQGKALTASTADTQAEIDDLKMNTTIFDRTSGVFTIDAAAADTTPSNGLVILDGDPIKSTLIVGVMSDVTLFHTQR